MWLLPACSSATAIVLSIPLSALFRLADGRQISRAARSLRWFEELVDTGPQDWKQYVLAMLGFSDRAVRVRIRRSLPAADRAAQSARPRLLEPTTIFHTVISFMTNTNLQHYSGDQSFSNFSQIVLHPAEHVPFGVDRLLRARRDHPRLPRRGDGRQFLRRYVARRHVHLCAGLARLRRHLHVAGHADDLSPSTEVATTLEPGSMGLDDKGQAKPQTIVVGPVAAVIPIKMLGTNGGGFYGMNSAHPLENPTATSNFFTTLAMMIFPFSLVLMYGRMLGRIRHSVVIYGVMLTMMIGLIVWVIGLRHHAAEPGPDRACRRDLSDRQSLGAERQDRRGQPASRRAAGRSASRQSRGQGIALRDIGRRRLRGDHHRRHLRRDQRGDGQSQSARRPVADDRHVGQLRVRRQGRRHDQPALVPHRRRVPRRTDGRPHARISGQEGRRAGNEAGDDRAARAPDPDPRARAACSPPRAGERRRNPIPARMASARSSTSIRPPRRTTARRSTASASPTGSTTTPTRRRKRFRWTSARAS